MVLNIYLKIKKWMILEIYIFWLKEFRKFLINYIKKNNIILLMIY